MRSYIHGIDWINFYQLNGGIGVVEGLLCTNTYYHHVTTGSIIYIITFLFLHYLHRVMLHHKEKSNSTIPSPHKLTNPNQDWHGVSTVAAQFDKYLKQLGKTSLEREELVELLQTLSDANFRINHNPLKVFIYTIEQLEDVNNARRRIFEMDLQHFLGLETPFYDFSSQAKSNVNTVTYPEYIDICQPEYNSIRNMLVMEGKKSSEWIMDRFLLSEDVVVSNGDYFREKLRSWGEDPCSTVPRETMKGKI